jgi:hypothetical protein
MIQCVYEEIGSKEEARVTSDNLQYLTQGINLQEKRYLNHSLISISMGLGGSKNVVQSRVNVQPNVNASFVNVNLNPQNVNTSAVNVNTYPQMNVNQSAVNVNQSAVNVNPNLNVNQSAVNVNLNPNNPQPANQNWMQNPKNVNSSNVNVQI